MEPIKIRTATPDDLEVLLGFEQGIINTERPWDPTIKDDHIHYYDIAQMITAPNVEVAVAVAGDEIIGSGYARLEDSKIYLKHPRHAFLGFMYVKPEYRGRGVNKMVIEALQRWALSHQVTEFRLEVYNDNLSAIKAYEKLGFSKLMITMRMNILQDIKVDQ